MKNWSQHAPLFAALTFSVLCLYFAVVVCTNACSLTRLNSTRPDYHDAGAAEDAGVTNR